MTDMFPDPGDDWRPKFKRLLLDLDARIDSAVFQSGKWTREIYERFTEFMDRAHVAGWRRWVLVEPLSEMDQDDWIHNGKHQGQQRRH